MPRLYINDKLVGKKTEADILAKLKELSKTNKELIAATYYTDRAKHSVLGYYDFVKDTDAIESMHLYTPAMPLTDEQYDDFRAKHIRHLVSHKGINY